MLKAKASKAPQNQTFQAIRDRFAAGLLQWNRDINRRSMPWKGEKNPYRIWLSEIILQQTRVEQGLKYYQNFIRAFPDVHDLANAPQDAVFKLWEGLGYYSRCSNLIHTARFISKELNGRFPDNYEQLLGLKGVGSYTASAIASFAYNLPYAVLDGNVFRVISRIFHIETAIDSTEGKKQFSLLARDLLPKDRAGEFNQAIMDFGATVCKPVPACAQCFFSADCLAFKAGRQDELPVKNKKLLARDRWFHYLVLCYKDEVLIRQRLSKDIWQHLFEFFLIETPKPSGQNKVLEEFTRQMDIPYRILDAHQSDQRLTHQLIHFHFTLMECTQRSVVPGFEWVIRTKLDQYAFPKTLQQYIRSQGLAK